MTIEGCFRSLKTAQIHVKPMYHRLPERIEAHIRICLLGLLIQKTFEFLTGETWQNHLVTLKGLQATRYEVADHGFYRVNEFSSDLIKLLDKVGIQHPKKVLEVFPLNK